MSLLFPGRNLKTFRRFLDPRRNVFKLRPWNNNDTYNIYNTSGKSEFIWFLLTEISARNEIPIQSLLKILYQATWFTHFVPGSSVATFLVIEVYWHVIISKLNRCILKTIFIEQITSLWSNSLPISACWLVLEQILSTSFSHFAPGGWVVRGKKDRDDRRKS